LAVPAYDESAAGCIGPSLMFRGWLKGFLKRLADWLIDRWFKDAEEPAPVETPKWTHPSAPISRTTHQNSSGKVADSPLLK
jgi:hypothetical protein